MEPLTRIELIMSMSHFCMGMFDIWHRVVCSGGSSPGFGLISHIYASPDPLWLEWASFQKLPCSSHEEKQKEPSLLPSWGVAKSFFLTVTVSSQWTLTLTTSEPDHWPLHPWIRSHQRPQWTFLWLQSARGDTKDHTDLLADPFVRAQLEMRARDNRALWTEIAT